MLHRALRPAGRLAIIEFEPRGVWTWLAVPHDVPDRGGHGVPKSMLVREVTQQGRFRLEQGCYVDGSSYYVHIASPSGHIFQQWRRLLYEGEEEQSMYAEVAAIPPGAEGVTFSLLDDPRLGRLDHVPYGTGRATIMRAVLEGLAERSAAIVDALEAAGAGSLRVVAAGHPATIPLWRTLRAGVLARPLEIVTEPEIAALGAAILAARAIDATAADAIAASRARYEPDPLLVTAWRGRRNQPDPAVEVRAGS